MGCVVVVCLVLMINDQNNPNMVLSYNQICHDIHTALVLELGWLPAAKLF